MGRFTRILRHRWHDEVNVRRALPAEALTRLTARVAASERLHSGQIRICIEAGLPLSYLWRHLSARDRAVMLFGKLRVWDTARNNGVLIYLLLAERTIEIVADRGLNAQLTAGDWAAIIERMKPGLRAGRFEEALGLAVDAATEQLRAAFERTGDDADRNELPDAPVLL